MVESEHLKALLREANVLQNRLDVINDKQGEAYQYVTQRLIDTNRMIREETERLLAIERSRQEDRKLDLERDKLEQDAEKTKINAEIESNKLKQQKKSNWVQFGLKGLGIAGAIGGNLILMKSNVYLQENGSNMPAFVQKLLTPFRFDK